jgi:hypothetical protein
MRRAQLLAGPRLAQQEHGGVDGEHPAGQVHRPPEAGLRSDQALERQGPRPRLRRLAAQRVVGHLQLLAQALVVPRERPPLRGAAHDHEQLVRVPRLGDEVIDAPGVDGVHEAVDVGVGGEDDADGVGRPLLAPAEQLHPGHAGHAVVGDDHGDVVAGQPSERRLAALGAQHPELGGQDRLERVEDPRLVVDDQDNRLVHAGSPARAPTAVGAGPVSTSWRT